MATILRRLLACLVVFMLGGTLYAQRISDYNTDDVRTAKITYDENFNPSVELTLKNISSKTITTLEVTVFYSNKSNPYDTFSSSQESRIVQVTIQPRASGTVKFSIPKGRNNSNPSGYLVTRVRYSDGSVCQ